ncbi:MAG: SigE family RNA polymerase sigma factor [Acidimicrobiia bacterium]|jgi:RNA polymerase sigma-70 factor (ECF subfamily)
MAESEGLPEIQVPGSFELLYQSDYATVVGLVYGLTGSRWVAEDLAQEAFLRAHRDWGNVGAMNSPGGWVRRVALNLARSRWRRLQTESAARLKISSSDHAPGPEPDAAVEGFWREVRRLPSRQAQAVALHYVEDLSVSEIAVVLGVAEGTVKALLHQGRQRLRRQLVAKGLADEV